MKLLVAMLIGYEAPKLRIKNSSKKNIVYVEIQFNFPETSIDRPEMSYRSDLGIKPSVPSEGLPLLLGPDEEVTFRIQDRAYQELVRFIGTRTKLADLSTVELKIGFVVFDDLIGWANGIYFRQDPNKATRWIPLPDQTQH